MSKKMGTHRTVDLNLDRRTFLLGSAASAFVSGAGIALAEEPKRGGNLVIGMAGGSGGDTLNPGLVTAPARIQQAFMVMNGLIEIKPDMTLTGEIIETWEPNSAATEWVLNVRQGVEFHNGKTVDADDIIYSINQHRGADTKSSLKSLLGSIVDVRKVTNRQVVVVLDAPNGDMPYILADHRMLVIPSGFTDWHHPVGTGPYEFELFEPGVRSLAIRNKKYWKVGRAHVDSVELIEINDMTARINALLSGAVHAISSVDLKSAKLLESNPNTNLVRASGGQHYVFAMNCQNDQFKDRNVRLALKHAVDREQAFKTVLRGYGKIGNDHPIPESDPYYNPDIAMHSYDPDKAKFFLKQAGLSDLTVQLSCADTAFSGAVDASVLFQNSAAKANIDIKVKREPADGYWENVWRKAPFCTTYWPARPTPDQRLSASYISGASWNETAWSNPEFDSVVRQARSSLDVTLRKELYGRAQQLIHDDGGAVIPFFADVVDASSKQLKGFVPSPLRNLAGGRLAETVWFGS